MYCKICKKEKVNEDFYQGFTKCKKCIGECLNKFSNEKAFEEVKNLLHNNNYIINQELLHDIFFSEEDIYRGNDNLNKLSLYLKRINSLPQYKDYKYRVVNEEKSDIDFLNEDIEKIKGNLKKATFNNDPNAHGKWINSLRDALELKDKLDNKYKWKEFSSHYYEGDKAIKGENEYIALWEQNANNDIRNHRIFKVIEEFTTSDIEKIGEIYRSICIITNNVSVVKNIETILEHSLENKTSFCNILESISIEWNDISKEKQDKISLLMGGMRYKAYVPAMIECFTITI